MHCKICTCGLRFEAKSAEDLNEKCPECLEQDLNKLVVQQIIVKSWKNLAGYALILMLPHAGKLTSTEFHEACDEKALELISQKMKKTYGDDFKEVIQQTLAPLLARRKELANNHNLLREQIERSLKGEKTTMILYGEEVEI